MKFTKQLKERARSIFRSKQKSEYNFDGVDANYNAKVTVYPRPDGVYSLMFALAVPQA